MLGMKKTSITALLVAATILTLIAIILSLISISRPRWISYDTARMNPTDRPTYMTAYSRYRGVFMECLKDETDVRWVRPQQDCALLDRGWGFPDATDEDYWHIIRLRRAHAAMLILGIISLFFALFLLIGALAMTIIPRQFGSNLHSLLIKTIAAVLLFAILCFLATQFIFHVLMDEEKYLKTPHLNTSYPYWFDKFPTIIRYASSYFLLWAALACTALAALLPLALICWGLDSLFGNKRHVRTVEEKTVLTSGPYGAGGQSTMMAAETVQVTTSHPNEAGRTHPGDTTAPYSYTGVSTTNAY
jgi:hypothetical protein